MKHVIQPGDTLSQIAESYLHDAARWKEIAKLNRLSHPDRIVIGTTIFLPDGAAPGPVQTQKVALSGAHPAILLPLHHRPANVIPFRAFLFVIADEANFFTRKVIRRVLSPTGLNDTALLEKIMHPELHGFLPRDPSSAVSLGRHALGRTDSRFISASERSLGSPRFEGKRFWIDVDKAKAHGSTLHETEAIIEDLKRISAKTRDPKFRSYIDDIAHKVEYVDHEVAFEGAIPAVAVKTAGRMAATRGLQFVEGVGIVLSAYDLSKAGLRSYRQGSVRPIAAESVRQAGGWGGAWAGAQIGSLTGAAFGIETGPGGIYHRRCWGSYRRSGRILWSKLDISPDRSRQRKMNKRKPRSDSEVPPPWAEYPGFPPGAFFWREAGEPWLTQVWEPYWKSLSAEQLNSYLTYWQIPDAWRMLYFDPAFRTWLDSIDAD